MTNLAYVRQTSVPRVLQHAHIYACAGRMPHNMRDSAEGPLCRPNEASMMQVDRDDFACDPAYSNGNCSNGDCSTSGDYIPTHARGQSQTSSQRSLDIRAKAVLRVETLSRRSLKVRHCPSVRVSKLPPCLLAQHQNIFAAAETCLLSILPPYLGRCFVGGLV